MSVSLNKLFGIGCADSGGELVCTFYDTRGVCVTYITNLEYPCTRRECVRRAER